MDHPTALSPEINGLGEPVCWKPWQIVYLKKDFYTALQRLGGLSALKDYKKLRSAFSLRDIAEFVCLNNYANILDPAKFDRPANLYFWDDATKDELDKQDLQEMSVSLQAYIQDPSFRNAVKESLYDAPESQSECEAVVQNGEVPPKTKRYKVVVLRDTVYIVVEEGFLSDVATGDAERDRARLAFLTDALKGMYVVMSIPQAHKHDLYHQYVKALAAISL